MIRTDRTNCRRFERTSAWHTLAAQFKNVLILILLAATLLSGLLGHALEAVVIAIIVLFAVLLGFIQEYPGRAGARGAARQMAAPLAHVIRDGVERSVAARERRAWRPRSCCARVIACRPTLASRVAMNLAIDEAALTGESAAINKTARRCSRAGAARSVTAGTWRTPERS